MKKKTDYLLFKGTHITKYWIWKDANSERIYKEAQSIYIPIWVPTSLFISPPEFQIIYSISFGRRASI